MLPPRTLAEVPAPSAICPRRKSEQAGRRRLQYDRELPSQVDELCMGHPCHRANPRNRKMNHNCQKSWNGENRVVRRHPEFKVALVAERHHSLLVRKRKCLDQAPAQNPTIATARKAAENRCARRLSRRCEETARCRM